MLTLTTTTVTTSLGPQPEGHQNARRRATARMREMMRMRKLTRMPVREVTMSEQRILVIPISRLTVVFNTHLVVYIFLHNLHLILSPFRDCSKRMKIPAKPAKNLRDSFLGSVTVPLKP
jgi:hypothetical protein